MTNLQKPHGALEKRSRNCNQEESVNKSIGAAKILLYFKK